MFCYTLKIAFTYSYVINLIIYKSKDVAELEAKELHTVSSDVLCLNWKKKQKDIVNFKAIICNAGRVVFNLQKKQKEKKKCAEN